MPFPKIQLSQIADAKGGKRLPKGEDFSPVKTHHPYIRARDIGGGEITFNNPVYITEEVYRRINRYTVESGDICITIVGANVGDVGQVPAHLKGANLTENAVKLVGKSHDYVADYVKFALLTEDAQAQMKSTAAGAAQPKLGIYKINSIEIPYPSRSRRLTIASILSAYDDLIENNTRRIEILEQIARRLYEEWFVHFRFPGHEEVSFKETELGGIPEGWEVVQLSEVSEYISRGISPKYSESDCRVVNQKCIRDNRLNMALSREQIKKVPEAKYVKFGDVLINSTGVGTLGRVAQVYEPLENVTVDSHVTIVRPLPEIDFDFFGIGLQGLQPYFEGLGVGATGQTELSRVRVGETAVILPPAELQKKFGELVRPMRRACIKYGVKNINLRAQRDLLLPKLVSGEIDVSDLPLPDDKEVEAA